MSDSDNDRTRRDSGAHAVNSGDLRSETTDHTVVSDRRTVVEREREEHGGIKLGSCFFGWMTATGMAILLTALAAMIGAAVILTDPIFQGLAISLLFGLASSTLLTVLVIPAIYRVFRT